MKTIENGSIRTITFRKDSDEDLKFAIFERLNTGSVPLNDMELRNCIYRGNYIELLKKMAENTTFRKLIGIKTADKNNMRVRVIGDTTRLSARFQKQIVELEAASAKNDGLNLQIAINYGSRDEMIRAMKKMCQDMENGTRQVSELNEDLFASYLDTAGIPDPDLLIRTSGEQRLSNYLLWQLAYSEFYFTDVPWPDFGKEELEKAVEAYNKRDRRFGGLAEEAK